MLDPPEPLGAPPEEIERARLAFDGDAVLLDGASERFFQHGLEVFKPEKQSWPTSRWTLVPQLRSAPMTTANGIKIQN
jgi:hypothetical protein